ncbi:MAG: HU family DNA-binding protein [Candidatus Izimaplasma sp.]|nr:HU family DNA-binding protein [Candidatus Izimaplasma bacterium]
MNTKQKVVHKDRILKIIATRLGLEVGAVEEVMEMYRKVIIEHLRKDFKVSMDELYTIDHKKRAGYTFRSGLNQKKYKVASKHDIKIIVQSQFIDDIARR